MFLEFSHAISLEVGKGRANQELVQLAEQSITEVETDTEPAPERPEVKLGFQANPEPECDCEECRP